MRNTAPDLPTVTVIIPCFNHAQYLPTSIECALGQDYPNIEVIVVNDGSSDNTAEVARQYADKGVVLIDQQNAGLSASRNAGIMLGRGDVICFLDADDRMDTNLISERMKLFEHDRVGIVAGAYRFTDPDLVPFDEEHQVPPPSYLVDRKTTLWAALSPNCGLLVRRRVFVECGYYDPMLKACEDWDQQIRTVQKFEHRFDPIRRSDYRQLPRSMSRDPMRMYDNARTVLNKAGVYYTNEKWLWRWNSMIGMSKHSMYQVLVPIWKSSERGMLKTLFLKRPATIFHFGLLIGRFALGRVRRLFFGRAKS